MTYDAFLLLSFGGPESSADVMPFLRNVVRGRNVPVARLEEVAHHYEHCGGKSPINDQNRALITALEAEFRSRRIELPIYWGNRNWHPLLVDTVRRLHTDGRKNVLALATSAYSSYSGCRQYLDDIERARSDVADAPRLTKIPPFWNHPRYLAATIDRVRDALAGQRARVLFTAHSIPLAMARACDYESQLRAVAGQVAAALDLAAWDVVYQSRSGPPTQPWLEPDILDHLKSIDRPDRIVMAPIGFVSDHVEVLYDLDVEAMALCQTLGIEAVRAQTVGMHTEFVRMVADLVATPFAECPAGHCPRG
ncbi:MAG TPA: ferrochelatase [Candidatus Xenobia bacterium]|jgi:ferrochelatase